VATDEVTASESSLKDGSQPSLLGSVIAGLVAGLLAVTFMFSYSAVILTGELAPFVPQLTGHFLLGGVVLALIVGVRSQHVGIVALPQNNPTAVLAVIVVSVLAGTSSLEPVELFTTILALIALSTIVGGVMLWTIGKFRLAQAGNYVPYPVIAGFLAATGWLLFKGSFGVMSGVPFDLGSLTDLGDVSELWIPGVVFAVALWAISKFLANALLIPLAIILAIAGFYVVLAMTGTTQDQAILDGWLLEPFGGGFLIEGVNPGDVEWSIVSNEAGGMLSLLILVAISVLLNLTALSATFGREIDLDRELRMTGVANVVAGAGGSLIGYHYVSLSTLGKKLKGESRIVGVVVALVCLFALTVGSNYLAYIPRFVLGGMVMFVGLGFLDDWLVQSARKLSRADLGIIVAILAVVEVVGFLEGVALGLVATVIIFVVNYSRISVIRHELSGRDVRSTIERPPAHEQVLSEHGDSLLYLKLHGFVFFATIVGLLEKIGAKLDEPDADITHLILDFEQVTGVDTTALHGVVKLKNAAEAHGVVLVACSISDELAEQLASEEFADGDATLELHFDDADAAVEWCEDEILRLHGVEPRLDEHPLPELLASILESPEDVAALSAHFEVSELDPGDQLVHSHDVDRHLHFVARGQLTVYAEEDEVTVRLRRATTGALLGVAAFFSPTDPGALATITADTPATVHSLGRDAFDRLAASEPRIAMALQHYATGILADRLAANLALLERTMSEER